MTNTKTDPLQTQYLTFVVGEEEYGVRILRAKEIIEYGVVTTIPNAPPFIRGVINLRGRVVPVGGSDAHSGRIQFAKAVTVKVS